jgi:hypothetical protein
VGAVAWAPVPSLNAVPTAASFAARVHSDRATNRRSVRWRNPRRQFVRCRAADQQMIAEDPKFAGASGTPRVDFYEADTEALPTLAVERVLRTWARALASATLSSQLSFWLG